MDASKIYEKSPLIIKKVLLNIKAFLNLRQRFNKEFYSYFERYKSQWSLGKTALEALQKRELSSLLTECIEYSPFYKARFDTLGWNKEDLTTKPIEVLKSFPILSKEDRKLMVDQIINTNPERKTDAVGHTSGTSGSPTINYLDRESINLSFALWKRFHAVLGFRNIHPKTVRFSGNLVIPVSQTAPPFWLYNIFEKQLYMSTYHLTEVNIPLYLDKLQRFKPELLDGYPSALFALAEFINRNGVKLKFKPRAIATTSETLYDEQRLSIEKAFDCKVYNQYASSEGSPFITECSASNLHLNLDSGYFELLNDNYEPALPGSIAKLVVTSFRNFKTPLIRYDIQDSVLLPETDIECDCGCNMPVVAKIIGREDDLLIANNGSYIGMSAYKIFKYASHIRKGQIIQKSNISFEINIEPTNDFDEDDASFLVSKVKESFGSASTVQINKLNEIPLSANGKFKAVIREFQP